MRRGVPVAGVSGWRGVVGETERMERAGVLGSELRAVSVVEKRVTVAVSAESWRPWWRVRDPADEGRDWAIELGKVVGCGNAGSHW